MSQVKVFVTDGRMNEFYVPRFRERRGRKVNDDVRRVVTIVRLRWLGNAGMFDNSFSQICPSKHFQILVRINLNYKHQVLYSSFISVSASSSDG